MLWPGNIAKVIAPAWPDILFETELWHSGLKYIAGIDEAGRGAWAGPVTAGAVILPSDDPDLSSRLLGVRDSKQMSAGQRGKWAKTIRQVALAVSTGWADFDEIDALGILPATRLAMRRAIAGLNCQIDHLLIDAVILRDVEIPQTSLIKGDARSLSIAAASIIAKTARDHYHGITGRKNTRLWFCHGIKGMEQPITRKLFRKLGVSPVHRKSYAPIKRLLN